MSAAVFWQRFAAMEAEIADLKGSIANLVRTMQSLAVELDALKNKRPVGRPRKEQEAA